jgi:hypothetical protein
MTLAQVGREFTIKSGAGRLLKRSVVDKASGGGFFETH